MIGVLWMLNTIAGLTFAIQTWMDYRKQKCGLTLCILLVFVCFCTGSAGVGAALLTNSPDTVAAHIWSISFLIPILLVFPAFFKYLIVYRGAYLEGGGLLGLFVLGTLCQSVLLMGLVNMVSMGILYFGCYEWLRHKGRIEAQCSPWQ